MIRHCALSVFVCAVTLPAQYLSLTTDRYGSKVAFSSTLTLRGETRNDYSKLFQLQTGGTPVTLRSTPAVYTYPGDRAPANYPALSRPEFSADGTRLAFTGERSCLGGSGCVSVERLRGDVMWLDGSRETPGAGTARISASGEWAIYYNPTSLVSPYRFVRVNLTTGVSEFTAAALYGTPGTGRRVVADDGTVVGTSGNSGLVVRRPKQNDITIPLSCTVYSVTLSTDGRWAIVQTADEHPMLWLVDLLVYQSEPIVWAAEGATQPALSDDGTSLMFLSGANWMATNGSNAVQVWTMDLVTGRLRQWTAEATGITEATISGDGQVVWAVNGEGDLLRVTGTTTTALAAAPQLSSTSNSTTWAPGSRYVLEGSSLEGATLAWQGETITPLRASSTEIEFIVPWDAATGAGSFTVDRADSPFQAGPLSGSLVTVAPEFIQTDGFVWGLRADGSPLMTTNPAAPGESVWLMLRGLGPYDASGHVLAGLSITNLRDASALDVLGAYADPGTPGHYLVQVRVPSSTQGSLWISVHPADEASPVDATYVPVAGS